MSDSAFQPAVPRGRRDNCKAIRVSLPTPFIILKRENGWFHSHSSSWLAAGRMVLKLYKASLSTRVQLRAQPCATLGSTSWAAPPPLRIERWNLLLSESDRSRFIFQLAGGVLGLMKPPIGFTLGTFAPPRKHLSTFPLLPLPRQECCTVYLEKGSDWPVRPSI